MMSSVGDTEVFIPAQAHVVTVPVRSLPSSITRKMSACPIHSDRPATLISPVELRERGTTHKPPPLTPGQFLLPVVTSNRKAFRTLRNFLHSGEISLPFSDENSRAASALSKKWNCIILFNTQIFLLKRKAKAPDWPLEQRSSTSSEREAPPPNSPVKQQDDDITARRRSKDGADAAEDHGKCAEVVKEREADESQQLTQDASTNTASIKLVEESDASAPRGEARSSLAHAEDWNAGESRITPSRTENTHPELTSEPDRANKKETQTGNASRPSDILKRRDDETKMSQSESSLAEAKCYKRPTFAILQDKSEIKGQICESEIPPYETKSEIAEDANEDVASSKLFVDIQSKGQSSRCESYVEIVDVEEDDGVSMENAAVTNVSKVEDLLKKFESLRRTINVCVNAAASPLKSNNRKRGGIAVETDADCDDLIIVESCAEVERVMSDTEVMEVDSGGADKPIGHVSNDERCANETSAKAKAKAEREAPVCKVTSSSHEAKGRESPVEIIDVDDNRVPRKSTIEANKDVTHSKRSSLTVKRCESAVEIVDLNGGDEVITNKREIINVHRRLIGDGDKGCRRRIFDGIGDETKSDVAVGAQISDVSGLSAKRAKCGDAEFSSGSGGLERDVNPNSQGKNDSSDVEIIEVDDDDDDDDDGDKDANQIVIKVKSCVKSDVKSAVSEAENESAAEELRKEGEQNVVVLNDGVCVQPCVREAPGAAEDPTLADKSSSEETNRDVTTSEVPVSESDVEDDDLAFASVTDQLNRGVATLESCAEPQTFERDESDPGTRAFDPDQDCEFTDQRAETTNQSARGEEAGVLPRPTSPQANREFDYVGLRREENINRIRARLRGMEKKLNTLMNSHH